MPERLPFFQFAGALLQTEPFMRSSKGRLILEAIVEIVPSLFKKSRNRRACCIHCCHPCSVGRKHSFLESGRACSGIVQQASYSSRTCYQYVARSHASVVFALRRRQSKAAAKQRVAFVPVVRVFRYAEPGKVGMSAMVSVAGTTAAAHGPAVRKPCTCAAPCSS